MSDDSPPVLRPLVLGDLPVDGDLAESWGAFCETLAREPGRVGVAHASASGDVEAWLKDSVQLPLLVMVGAEHEAALLRAGVTEVAEGDASAVTLERAIVRARARGLWRAPSERFRLMVEHSRDIVSVVDGKGRYVYVSPSSHEILGHTPEALYGNSLFETLHEADVESVMSVFLEAIGTPGSERTLSFRVKTASGEVLRFEGLGRALIGDDGEPYGIINSRDVTARVKAEDALRDSESRYRSLLGALPDVISRIRRDGTVLAFHVPPVFTTEFPPEAMLGEQLQAVIPEPLARKFEDAVEQVNAGSPGPVTYRYGVEVRGEACHREVRIVPHGEREVLSIVRDVTPEVRAEMGIRESKAKLEASQADLRALAARLQHVREEERTHLSREVHDSLGQQLTAIRYAVGWFGRQLPDDAEAVKRLADARELIDDTIQLVRRISADLRPGVLDDFGLVTALEWFAERTAERTGLQVRVVASGDASEVPAEVATAAFRIAQEALTNVARHAEATSVRISVETEPDALRIRVEDDGVGLDADAVQSRRSLGVLGMRERARALGGTLRLSGKRGQGAAVTASFPLSSSPE